MKIIYTFLAVVLIIFATGNTAVTGSASQAFHVIPAAYAGTPGTAVFIGPLANSQRTYQLLIHESQLTGLVGQYIDAITLRIPTSSTAPWPTSDATASNYDIYLGKSVPPANRSLVFAENVAGPQTQVRAGSLTITTGSFPSGGSPNEFGTDITFDSAYLYTGDHLLIEIRHTGFSGSSRSVDAIGTSTSGYGTNFSACWQGNYTATSGLQGNFSVIRLSSRLVGINNITGLPDEFNLSQNYPNPFNPVTNIKFDIPGTGNVKLRIFDLSGKEVAVLVNEKLEAGNHEVQWDAADYASGAYFFKLEYGNQTDTKKMLLIR